MGDGPRFDQLNVIVDDMEAAVAFYRRLGFDVPDVPPDWQEWQVHHRTITSPDGWEVDLDSAAFARVWGEVAAGVVVGVRLPSRQAVDGLVAELAATGHEVLKEPWDAFWGARYAVVRDPAGNAVGLMSEADPARQTPPPPPPA